MEKAKQDEIEIKIDDLPKEIEQSTSSEDSKSRSIKLHWSFNILIWYGYFTTKYRYQILFVSSFYQFSVWLHKLYEDIGQAIEYSNDSNDFAYFSVSILMLILPTLMCTTYLLLTKLIDTQCEPTRKDIIVQLINGLMLVPWQAKQCLDTLHYAAQRICNHVWSVYEKKEVFSMGVDCDLLEFFEDMFSGFLGICLQLYIILVNAGWTGEETQDGKILTGELVGSILSLLSMLEAIKRRDDGFINATYVRLGWIFMFISRALAICLATTIIKSWIIVFILVHAIGINCWVFYIARQSYIDVILNDLEAILDWKIGFGRGRCILWLLSFVIYGLPSIIYWPLMFQMKDVGRAKKFLYLILIENICLGAIWTLGVYFYQITAISDNHLIFMNCALLALTLTSIFWIHLYLKNKPYDTDKRVLLEILQEDRESQAECAFDYGVSYIFYSKIFALPTLKQLWRSIPPYCDEDRLLFNIEIDSIDEEEDENQEKCEAETKEEIKEDLKLDKSPKKIPNSKRYFNHFGSVEFSDADDEDDSDYNRPSLLYSRSFKQSKASLLSSQSD